MEESKILLVNRCIVKGCPGRNSTRIRLFQIPATDLNAWCSNIRIKPTDIGNRARVCSRHFEKACMYKMRLKTGARPTLRLGHKGIIHPNLKIKEGMSVRFCCIADCDATSRDQRLFKFPDDEERLNQWLTICVIKDEMIDELRKYICSKHFDPSMIHENGLRQDAIPNMDEIEENELSSDSECSSVLSLEAIATQSRICCIVGCNSVAPAQRLFSFPDDKERLRQWLLVCAIKDQMRAHKRKYICAKHFDPSMVYTRFLKRDAVPNRTNKSYSEAEIEAINALCDANKQTVKQEPCVVKGCPGRDTESIQLFKIPRDDIKAWCVLLNLKPANVDDSVRVCSRHFKKRFIGNRKIKKGGRPTLNLGNKSIILPSLEPIEAPKKYFCCILNCDVTCPPEDKLFMFPTDTERFQKWISICNIKKEIKARKCLRICRKHFDPSMINNFRLKRDAIPVMEGKHAMQNNLQPKTEDFENSADTFFEDSAENGPMSGSDSDIFDGLECKSFCHTCVEVMQECEKYRERFTDLEKMLQDEQANYEALRIENELLINELRARDLV